MNDSFEKSRNGDMDRIDQEAADWISRMDRELTEAEEAKFLEWLEIDPHHAERLKELQRSWTFCDKLGQWDSPVGASVRSEFTERKGIAFKKIRSFELWIFGIAALVVLGLASFWVIQSINSAEGLKSEFLAEGEQAMEYQRHILQDGSVVELNAGAQVEVLFSRTMRKLKLYRGEALFIVTKNPDRPFVVEVGGLDVCAVGTVFSLKVDQSTVEVLVTEGRVRVGKVEQASDVVLNSNGDKNVEPESLSEELYAGQKTVFFANGIEKRTRITEPTIQEITMQLSWRDEILEFSSTPLSEVVEAFNQRNFVKIVILDKELNSLKINAAVNPGNLENFLQLLQASADVESEWTDSGKVLLRK